MNAAARLVHQSGLFRHFLGMHFFTKRQIVATLLTAFVLLSALSVIYVTHVTRALHATYQNYLVEKNKLHLQRGQLLLERSTWMMQARIQHIAEEKLGMVAPNYKLVKIVRE
jgi:cell division protein FtsL